MQAAAHTAPSHSTSGMPSKPQLVRPPACADPRRQYLILPNHPLSSISGPLQSVWVVVIELESTGAVSGQLYSCETKLLSGTMPKHPDPLTGSCHVASALRYARV